MPVAASGIAHRTSVQASPGPTNVIVAPARTPTNFEIEPPVSAIVLSMRSLPSGAVSSS